MSESGTEALRAAKAAVKSACDNFNKVNAEYLTISERCFSNADELRKTISIATKEVENALQNQIDVERNLVTK